MRYPELYEAFYAPSLFPDDGRLWRVEWFGRLERNFREPFNHFLEVTLRRLRKRHRGIDVTLADALDVDPGHLYKAYIEISDLPYVHIGSIWRDGKYVASPEYSLFESDQLTFSETTIRIASPDGLDQIAAEDGALPPESRPVGCDPHQARFLAVEVSGDPCGLIIPVMEVVRFYYCPSPEITSRLFRGPFDLIANEIFNVLHTGLDPDGLCRACFRNDTPTTAARIAAILGTSEYAKRQVRRIYDTILVSHVTSGVPVVEALPPFEGNANLKARGAWFESGGRRRFLAYQILESNLPLPGRKLLYSWARDTAPGRSKYGLPVGGLDQHHERDWHPCLPKYTDNFETKHIGAYIYKRQDILRNRFDQPLPSTEHVAAESAATMDDSSTDQPP